MPSNTYLDEVAYLAAVVPRNRCPSTDALDVLDVNPHIRLALEDSWTDPGGRVYRHVPADTVSRWPAHLARCFRPLLRISRDVAQVLELLDELTELDADKQVVRSVLAACTRRKELHSAIAYFRELNEALRSVSYEPDRGVEVPADTPRCIPRCTTDGVVADSWTVSRPPEGSFSSEPPTHRVELLHDPTSRTHEDRSWVHKQPMRFRKAFFALRRADRRGLERLKAKLLDSTDTAFTRDQLTVLWDAYRVRRDHLRRIDESVAARKLSTTARKLVKRIERIRSTAEAGHVGRCLYDSMKGGIALPGPVAAPEWAVIFEAYRARRAQLQARAH